MGMIIELLQTFSNRDFDVQPIQEMVDSLLDEGLNFNLQFRVVQEPTRRVFLMEMLEMPPPCRSAVSFIGYYYSFDTGWFYWGDPVHNQEVPLFSAQSLLRACGIFTDNFNERVRRYKFTQDWEEFSERLNSPDESSTYLRILLSGGVQTKKILRMLYDVNCVLYKIHILDRPLSIVRGWRTTTQFNSLISDLPNAIPRDLSFRIVGGRRSYAVDESQNIENIKNLILEMSIPNCYAGRKGLRTNDFVACILYDILNADLQANPTAPYLDLASIDEGSFEGLSRRAISNKLRVLRARKEMLESIYSGKGSDVVKAARWSMMGSMLIVGRVAERIAGG